MVWDGTEEGEQQLRTNLRTNFRVVLDKNFAAATPRQKKKEMEKSKK